jgi:hypothetical protein
MESRCAKLPDLRDSQKQMKFNYYHRIRGPQSPVMRHTQFHGLPAGPACRSSAAAHFGLNITDSHLPSPPECEIPITILENVFPQAFYDPIGLNLIRSISRYVRDDQQSTINDCQAHQAIRCQRGAPTRQYEPESTWSPNKGESGRCDRVVIV